MNDKKDNSLEHVNPEINSNVINNQKEEIEELDIDPEDQKKLEKIVDLRQNSERQKAKRESELNNDLTGEIIIEEPEKVEKVQNVLDNIGPNNVNKLEQQIESSNVTPIVINNKSPEKKIKNKPNMIIIILLIVTIIFAVVYFLFLKPKEEDVPNEPTNNIIQMDTQSNTVKNAYDKILKTYIMGHNNQNSFYVYRDNKTTYDILSSVYIYHSVTANMLKSDLKMEQENGMNVYVLDIDTFNKTLKNIYGEDKSFSFNNLTDTELKENNGLLMTCVKRDDKNLICSEKINNENTMTDKIYTSITRAEKNDEYLYIYDEYLYVNLLSLSDGYKNVNLYKSENTKIASNIDLDKQITDLANGKPNKEFLADISSLYGSVGKYKHIFKKSGDSYYWVSTQINE